MNNTEITPELLLEKGFKIQIIEDRTFFRKGLVWLCLDKVWIPCKMINGELRHTNEYVRTWEELERLVNEAGKDID